MCSPDGIPNNIAFKMQPCQKPELAVLWAVGFVMHEDELCDLNVGIRELWISGCWGGKGCTAQKEFQVSFWLILFCSVLLRMYF